MRRCIVWALIVVSLAATGCATVKPSPTTDGPCAPRGAPTAESAETVGRLGIVGVLTGAADGAAFGFLTGGSAAAGAGIGAAVGAGVGLLVGLVVGAMESAERQETRCPPDP